MADHTHIEWTDMPRIVRWRAVVVYRTEQGPIDVQHDLCELEELQDLVERGPHWDAIIEIRLTRAETCLDMTVERAERE